MHLSWDKEGAPKIEGDTGALTMDATVEITIRGRVRGYSMHEYGCSIDVKPSSVKITAREAKDEDDEGSKSMVSLMKKMQAKGKD